MIRAEICRGQGHAYKFFAREGRESADESRKYTIYGVYAGELLDRSEG